MTGQEMTELFFTKVKGWSPVVLLGTGNVYGWKQPKESIAGYFKHNELPQLHTSLDLQEEWVWPELHRVNDQYRIARFELIEFNNNLEWACVLTSKFMSAQKEAVGETKPLAQLKASLKALGVL